jgi:hypothetical protein
MPSIDGGPIHGFNIPRGAGVVLNKISAIWSDGKGTTCVKDDFNNVPRVTARDKIGNEIGIKVWVIEDVDETPLGDVWYYCEGRKKEQAEWTSKIHGEPWMAKG